MPSGQDRISKAWALRNAIHTWLKGEGVATVVEAFAAFPEWHPETVRKALQRLRSDGDAMMTGRRGMIGSYRAVTEHIRPEAEKRARLAAGAQISHDKARAKKLDRFEAAYQMRVTIQKHISGVPDGCTAMQIAELLKVKHDVAYGNLRTMVEENVLYVVKRARVVLYFTTGKTEMVSADTMRQRMLEKKARSQAEFAAVRKVRGRPGVYIHEPDKPIPNQGGQGATRRGFGIQSCADFIF